MRPANRLLGLLLGLGLLAGPGRASAFAVSSGFSEPCHEHITAQAYRDSILDMATPWIVVPDKGAWLRLSDYLIGLMDLEPTGLDDGLKFVLVSLIMGVRRPDTDGHAMANLESLRRVHGDPRAAGQHAHSLRAPDEDYAEGDQQAVDGTRERILDLIAEGQSYLYLPADQQIIEVQGYLDFYGRFEIEVWAPMFYVGQAAHALQDTFSHTLRSDQDDLRKIVHVVNYIDAIGKHHREERDGLAHSVAMDNCFRDDMQELTQLAIEATVDLNLAVRQQFNGWDPNAVTHVLDKWVTLRPGCTFENHFCDNERWERLGRTEQTGPYIEEMLGCGAVERGAPEVVELCLLLMFGAIWLVRRFRTPNR